MAHRDDVTKVAAVCDHCEAVYAARQWPNGTIRVIGRTRCRCGSESFTALGETGDTGAAGSGAE
ncbi:hypothetical protein [Natronobiforma cellulositropha]|uniref:hypothetical protein n=1 Tax=Natronobiforma cellulositropha TaxID=1679076 RepID=UPI0021D5C48F|nr:hypothetical protein [Natronobiforma cellulositropha]